jgi:serine phosphatase RsbU (regulator of sigma subunit)/anti-sigma regulatory factor (Ser/Thr protein kinase)/ABC-type transporter Mla MlaB component
VNQSNEPIAAAFEEMPAALFVLSGSEHVVVAANRVARAITGNRPFVGQPIRAGLPELEGQQILEVLDEAYGAGQLVIQPERRVLVDRNGDGSLEEGFFSWAFVPVRFADGTRGTAVQAIETTDFVRRRQAAESRAVVSERRYREALDVVLALQEHLLPRGVPVLPSVRLAARYVVAGRETAAGGDLFDAVPLANGRVVLMVGDVVGHGAPAAALMGQLRAVALESLSSGVGIVETAIRLSGLAARLRTARGATIFLAELDPSTGDLRYVSYAHPPALVLDPGAGARFLPPPQGFPLGVGDRPPTLCTDRLRPGQQLLLYSDGLVERAGRTLSDGLTDLSRVASAALADPIGPDTSLPPILLDRVCALVIERMGTLGYNDDVTLLAAELLAEPWPAMELSLPAVGESLAGMRRALGSWFGAVGVSAEDASTVVHAVQEACMNIVEHAYGVCEPDDPRATIEITARVTADGMLELEVADRGQWRAPAADPGGRGRGLMMMRGLIDTVDIVSTLDGTRVRLRHPLSRLVAVGTAQVDSQPSSDAEARFGTELIRADRPVLKVTGPVDQDTADRVRVAAFDAGRGGGLALTLDLSEVTHLASAGLQMLHELDTQLARSDAFRLVAPIDGAAYQVLLLGGLGHRLDPALGLIS